MKTDDVGSIAQFAVQRLRCEYLEDPLAIGSLAPRLSWTLKSSVRGEAQKAYQILVARSEQALANDDGDLWDSGKVESGENVNIVYSGKELKSRDRCFWKVRVWNCANCVSDWSKPSCWGVGLLSHGDWTARCVSPIVDLPVTKTHFGYRSMEGHSAEDEKWVQIDLGSSCEFEGVRLWGAWPIDGENYDRPPIPGDRFPLRFRIDISDESDFSMFTTIVDCTGEDVQNPGEGSYEVFFARVRARYVRLTGTKLMGNYYPRWDDAMGRHYPVPVEPATGWKMILAEMEVLCDGANLALGKPVTALDSYEENSENAPPQTQGYSKDYLTDGRIQADPGGAGGWQPQPVTLIRRDFSVTKPVSSATLYATSHIGLYEAYLNGSRIGDNELSPERQTCYEFFLNATQINNRKTPPFEEMKFYKEWRDAGGKPERELTSEEQCCLVEAGMYYQTYDVTAGIMEGENAIAVMLANGFVGLGSDYFDGKRRFQEVLRAFIGQLEIRYEDGTSEIIGTDRSWLCHTDGPMRKTDFLYGSQYDARKEVAGWNMPGADTTAWRGKLKDYELPIDLFPQPMQPVKVLAELPAVNRIEPEPGTHVYDFGRNMAGVCRIRLQGPAGTAVSIRYAEAAEDDGRLYFGNFLRGCYSACDTVILSGKGNEEFFPKFTYHGFRFAEVSGLTAGVRVTDITALSMGSTVPGASSFRSSDPTLNALCDIVHNTYRSSMFGLECVAVGRDERAPWLGDFQLQLQSLSYFCDFAAFGANENRVIVSALGPGGFPGAVLSGRNKKDVALAAWSDASVKTPVALWTNFADRKSMELSYEGARKFMDTIAARNPGFLPREGYISQWGDWHGSDHVVAPNAKSWGDIKDRSPRKEILAAAWWGHSADLVAQMAVALDKPADARHYSELRDNIRRAMIARYVSPDGTVTESDVQSTYALILGMGHVDRSDELYGKMSEHLVRTIQEYDNHFSTGFVCTVFLLNWLSENGHHDLACRLVLQQTCPSYGAMVRCGATAMWERWDCCHPEMGYNPGSFFWGGRSMNIAAHTYLYEWIVAHIGGIAPDPLQPGYRHFYIYPKMGGNISAAEAEYESIRGKIVSTWKLGNGVFLIKITVPPGCSATVFIPGEDMDNLFEGEMAASSSPGVRSEGIKNGRSIYKLESGSYEFKSRQQAGRAGT